MMILISIFNLAFLSFIVYKHWVLQRGSSMASFYWPALMFKVLTGIGLGLIYLYYYQIEADTFLFFEDSKKLTALARSDFFSYVHFMYVDDESHPLWAQIVYQQSRSLFMVKITSLIGLLTFDNYWITSLYFSLLSFFGAWTLTTSISDSFPSAKTASITAFLFIPSVVFWSSGLIKESIAMAALFFLAAVVVKIWSSKHMIWWEWCLAVIAAWLEWRLKHYYFAVFFPIAASALFTQRLSHVWRLKKPLVKSLVWVTTFIAPLALISSLKPNFYPTRILEVIVSNNHEFIAISDPGDFIEFKSLEPTVSSIVANIPKAVFSGLLRPFVWEAQSIFQWWIAIENLLILFLIATALRNITMLVRSQQRLLLFSILFYVIVLCAFLALSTPNFGTLSRYRISFLPFFVFLVTIENPFVRKLQAFIQRS